MTSILHRSTASAPVSAGASQTVANESPLRLLLIRERSGDLPWVVQAITQLMAPVELVEVLGLPNALWRLGRERFDSVLLDLDPADRLAIDLHRRHISETVAIPILDLSDEAALALGRLPRRRHAG